MAIGAIGMEAGGRTHTQQHRSSGRDCRISDRGFARPRNGAGRRRSGFVGGGPRSPCTEEIAVFRAFAREVDRGTSRFVVLDTAPTGHTLLLLDASETYQRELQRQARTAQPQDVLRPLPAF